MLRMSAALVAVAVTFAAAAEDKKDAPKLTGAWVREAEGGVTITLDFKAKDKLTASAKVGDATVSAECKYAVEADGTLKVTVITTSTEGVVPDLPEKLLSFELKFKIDGKTATLSDFNLGDLEKAKKIMEGEYKAKEK